MSEYTYPLGWGLGTENTKKFFARFPTLNCRQGEGFVSFKYLTLKNFDGDCGSLTIHGANLGTADTIAAAVEYASTCGFDKIFATLVKENAEDYVQPYLDAGFKVLSSSPSNRNPNKTAIALFLHIENPINKGYYYD